MSATTEAKKQNTINDRWLFIFVYPVIALAVVHIGNDNSFGELLRNPTYYSDILLALGCTYLLGLYFNRLYKNLPRERSPLQLILKGFVLPVVVLMCIEMLYLIIIDIPLEESSMLYLELPVVAIFCILINLIYLLISKLIEQHLSQEGTKPYQEQFIVNKGSKQQVVPLEEVSYFYIEQKLTFLVTFQGKHYHFDCALKDVMPLLSPKSFFQLNRQVIAHRNSIVQYEKTETRRLRVALQPTFSEPIFIAKSNAVRFDQWMKKENLSASGQ